MFEFGPHRGGGGEREQVECSAERGQLSLGHFAAAAEEVVALSEYLGHSDPGFTLRTYTHLLPSSETRTRKAIDDAFTETGTRAEAEDDGDPPAAQGTSPPPAKPMCPQCALAA